MMKFLSQAWADRTSMDQATFEAMANAMSVSKFNAFVKFNLNRWSLGKMVSQSTAVNEGVATATLSNPVITPAVKAMNVGWDLDNNGSRWTTVLYRSETAAPAGLKNEAIAVYKSFNAETYLHQDAGLKTGTTYYYAARVGGGYGSFGTLLQIGSAVAG